MSNATSDQRGDVADNTVQSMASDTIQALTVDMLQAPQAKPTAAPSPSPSSTPSGTPTPTPSPAPTLAAMLTQHTGCKRKRSIQDFGGIPLSIILESGTAPVARQVVTPRRLNLQPPIPTDSPVPDVDMESESDSDDDIEFCM